MVQQSSDPSDAAADVVRSLHRATCAHDLEGIVAHFAADYVLEDPVHPDRSFYGADQVRRNWAHLLASMPDLVLEERGLVAHGSTVWTEIELRGRAGDGQQRTLCGVMIFTIEGSAITAGRFYVAPVVRDGLDADAAVRAVAAGGAR